MALLRIFQKVSKFLFMCVFRCRPLSTGDSNSEEGFIRTEENHISLDSNEVSVFTGPSLPNSLASAIAVCLRWATVDSLRYDDDVAMVYLAARVAGGYAAVRRALNEVKYL